MLDPDFVWPVHLVDFYSGVNSGQLTTMKMPVNVMFYYYFRLVVHCTLVMTKMNQIGKIKQFLVFFGDGELGGTSAF